MKSDLRIVIVFLLGVIIAGLSKSLLASPRNLCDSKECKEKALDDQKKYITKETELYKAKREGTEYFDSLQDDINQLEITLKSMKSDVKLRLEQMHQIIDSDLVNNNVFKVTVDNLK